MLMPRLPSWCLLALAVSAQPALAEGTDVSGLWTGTTTCPAGRVSFTIDVQGTTGTFRHDGFGPDKQYPANFPIAIRFMKGWEGEWVYFEKATSGDASFASLNGLLSRDGRQVQVRQGTSIGDCQAFVLAKARAPQPQPQPQPAVTQALPTAPPQNREPTEAEMREALEYSLHGDGNAFKVDNPLNGITTRITGVEKLGCSPAHARAGYVCDYIVELDTQFYSNEGTADGHRHAEAVQTLFGWLQNAHSQPGPQTSSGRFLYVPSRNRWMKMSD